MCVCEAGCVARTVSGREVVDGSLDLGLDCGLDRVQTGRAVMVVIVLVVVVVVVVVDGCVW